MSELQAAAHSRTIDQWTDRVFEVQFELMMYANEHEFAAATEVSKRAAKAGF